MSHSSFFLVKENELCYIMIKNMTLINGGLR